jgi:hypothetical protein
LQERSIVAVYFFREMFPNIPPVVGVRADYLSVYWAVMVAAITACTVAVVWIRDIYRSKEAQKLGEGA